MVRTTAATIVLASLLMTACTTSPRAGSAESDGGNTSLAGTRWALQALGRDAVPRTPTVTLNFGLDGQITGNDGCNQYQGGYTDADPASDHS